MMKRNCFGVLIVVFLFSTTGLSSASSDSDSCAEANDKYFPYKTTFSGACMELNHCFKNKEASKSDCVVAFHYNLVMTCMHNRQTPFGTFPYQTCIKVALLYLKTVKKYGDLHNG